MFSDILKNNTEPYIPNQKLEDNVMEMIHSYNNENAQLQKLWSRSKTVMRLASLFLILIVFSIVLIGSTSPYNLLTNYCYLLTLLSIGLFYILLTTYWSIRPNSG